jgi:hypothetical protein
MIWGIDVSDYQGDMDMARVRAEGVDFAMIKATQGAGWRGRYFRANLDRAHAAGLLTCAYHYQEDGDAAAQVDNIAAVVPRDVPVIPDVEANSGGLDVTWDLITRLRGAGYIVPLLYLPRWYWQQIGSPDLSGLPPLWSSHYPDMSGGFISEIWQRVPESYWDGYGNLPVEVLQFSSASTIAGRHPIDANAYGGTRDDLARVLGLTGAPAAPPLPDIPELEASEVSEALDILRELRGLPVYTAAAGADGQAPTRYTTVADATVNTYGMTFWGSNFMTLPDSAGPDAGKRMPSILELLVRAAYAPVAGVDEKALADDIVAAVGQRLEQSQTGTEGG